jgi:VIT1/CCC1 family predicted Fe2+/Mn2+ transporter
MTTERDEQFVHHPDEPHVDVGLAQRLNWLRAGVLGANDGIISVAAVVVGMAAATTSQPLILAAGLAALVGGAISMAQGEYVSVSSQADTEKAQIAKERRELEEDPEGELEELTGIYESRGMSRETAHRVAVELTEADALRAHLTAELGIRQEDVVNPWHAAIASAVSFTIGATLPMLAVLLPSVGWRIPTTVISVLAALVITGWTAAYIGDSPRLRPTVRQVVGGIIALAATYLVGQLLGVTGVVS